jgi:hypothetical protein
MLFYKTRKNWVHCFKVVSVHPVSSLDVCVTRDTHIDTHIRIYQPMEPNMPKVFDIKNTAVQRKWTHMSVNDSPADT